MNLEMSKFMFKLPESSSSLICVIYEICGKLFLPLNSANPIVLELAFLFYHFQ
jgi:hypothetical protein